MSETTSAKKAIVNSVIYTFSGLLLKCFSFFLLPLYTVYLTTEDYGITSVSNSFIGTMVIIASFSLYTAVSRFYVEYKAEPEKLKRFYGTVVLFTLIASVAWGLVLTVFRGALTRYVFSGVDFWPVIVICLGAFAFNIQHTVYTAMLKSQQKAMAAALLSIASFFIKLALNIYFVVVAKKGAVGVLLATMISDGVIFLISIADMLRTKTITFCLDFKLLKSALFYSVPIMPHNLSTSIASLISKVLIGDQVSLASLGLYTVAAQFGNIADTIQNYVDSAYGPWLYEKLHAKEENYKKDIRKIVKFLVSVIGLFFLGIALFSHDYIILFFDASYAQAWTYIPMTVAVFAIKTIYYFYVEVLFYYKKASRLLFVATLSSSILNVLLTAFMVPLWGVYGSIVADAISMVVRVAIVVYISKCFEDIGLRFWDFVGSFVETVLFIAVGSSLSYTIFADSFSWWNFAFKVLIVMLYVGKMMLLHKEQIKAGVLMIKRKNRKGKGEQDAGK